MRRHHIILDIFHVGLLADAELQISASVERSIGEFFHSQDFFELMYILCGSGKHFVNGHEYPLQPGQLVWITPRDSHDIGYGADQNLQFFNLKFAAALWTEFCGLMEINPFLPCPQLLGPGKFMLLTNDNREKCEEILHHYLPLLREEPTRYHVCKFWISILPYLRQELSDDARRQPQPAWLVNACRAMHNPKNMSSGLPRLLELSGVSMSHLSRVLKTTTGQSPTEYINGVRLNHAVESLVYTSDDITDIAIDCGFENLSYFYRLFRRKYGKSPRAFRMSMRSTTPIERQRKKNNA